MKNSPKIIRKVSLAVFKDKKLLVVRSDDQSEVFYSLGGTIEEDESEIDCLAREVKEEISCEVDRSSLEFLAEFEDVAHGRENTLVNIKMYKGNLIGEPEASSEVVEIGYFDSQTDQKHLSEIAIKKIFPWLKDAGYIN